MKKQNNQKLTLSKKTMHNLSLYTQSLILGGGPKETKWYTCANTCTSNSHPFDICWLETQ